MAFSMVSAQGLDVEGVVVSADDDVPLPGVNVVVEGTEIGTVTNANGHYQIRVPDSDEAVLVFSFVGYETQEVPVDGRSEVHVSLAPDVSELGEVVVVGYGEQRRSRISASIASVDAATIEQSTGILSPEQAIQGRVAGANITSSSGMPGAGLRVEIRGSTSIQGGNEPLYVIDGIPVNGSDKTQFGFGTAGQSPLLNITPSDIESIEILKDASATAIYGSRASNGVVLITTKSGAEGPTRVRFSSSVGMETVPRRIDIASSDTYFEVMNEARENYNQDHGLAPGDPGYEAPLDDPREPGHEDTDWFDLVTRDRAQLANFQVGVSGGDDRTQFYTSGSYTRHEGIIKTNQIERLSARVNVSHRVSDRFDLEARIGLSRSVDARVPNERIGNGILTRSLEQRPFDTPYKEDGSYQIGGVDILRHNGVQVLNELDANLTTNQVTFNLNGTFDLLPERLPGLRYQGKLAGEGGLSHEYVYRTANHPYGGAAGIARDYRTIDQNYTIDNTITYDGVVGNSLYVSGLVGHSFQRIESDPAYIIGEDFPSPSFGLITSAANVDGSTSWTAYALQSFISRLNMNYDERYNLTFTLRRDGSSKFAKGNRYGTFPSVSVGWRLAQESFLASVDALSELRLRASFGMTGNQEGIGNFTAVPQASGGDNYRQQTGIAVTRLGNPDLTWETAKQYNVGLDLGLFDGRFELTTEYYIQRTEDLLYNLPLHRTTGFSSIAENIGNMSNRGLEISIGALIMDQGPNWSTDFNISFARNELTSLIGEDPIPVGRHVIKEGEALGTFFLLEQDGLYQHDDEVPQALYDKGVRAGDVKFTDVDGDGDITSADRKVVGTANPDFHGGLTNTLSYGNLDFSAQVTFRYGNKVYNEPSRRLDSMGALTYALRSEYVDDRWTGPNTSNDVPRAALGTYNIQHSTRFLEDGSYLRLQNVTLGYTLPERLTSTLNGHRLRFYVAGKNLLTLTGYSGMDPAVSTYLDPRRMGLDEFNVPPMRALTLGVDLEF